MSGHSKWSTIKRQKAVTDARRSAIFTKYGRLITIAARSGGGDPDMNFRLRLAIDKAKSVNMPNDNIERAVKVGTGELRGDQTKELVYEGFGPAGVAIMVETVTDNPNRTAGDLRTTFAKHGGNLGSQNSVGWMFSRQGVLHFSSTSIPESADDFFLGAIDAGATDVQTVDGHVIVYCVAEALPTLRTWSEGRGLKPEESGLELVPTTTVVVSGSDQEKLYELLDALDEHPDVTSVVTNEA